MPLNGSPNTFKAALAAGEPQIGIWASMCSPLVTELMAGAGFDWILVDSEHAPNDLSQIVTQLQTIAAYPTEAVVRIPTADATLIKRHLDSGARSLLIPFVEDAEAARRIVAATRYPPKGIRGVSVAHRGNRFGRVPDYLHTADDTNCIVVQIETRKAVDAILEIAAVDGIDAVFIGPSDLSADLGHLGGSSHPEVQAVIQGAIERCRAAGRPIGILAPIQAEAKRWLELGATMVAVGSDAGVLRAGTDAIAKAFGRQGH
jgi:2-keto-3-deoxy-L-rhamnonate aldolase RhmA